MVKRGQTNVIDPSFRADATHVFVFGSNLAGRHGAGGALYAREHCGAVPTVGIGRTGNSFAIPTKGYRLEVLPLDVIKLYCEEFVTYAHAHPEVTFLLTRIGCGLAGYKDFQIAPFFENCSSNIIVSKLWLPHIKREHNATPLRSY